MTRSSAELQQMARTALEARGDMRWKVLIALLQVRVGLKRAECERRVEALAEGAPCSTR